MLFTSANEIRLGAEWCPTQDHPESTCKGTVWADRSMQAWKLVLPHGNSRIQVPTEKKKNFYIKKKSALLMKLYTK